MKEMIKLVTFLDENGYIFEYTKKPIPDREPAREQIVVYDNIYNMRARNPSWDVIGGYGAYGDATRPLELMGDILTEQEREIDSVVGYLTAQDIIDRLTK